MFHAELTLCVLFLSSLGGSLIDFFTFPLVELVVHDFQVDLIFSSENIRVGFGRRDSSVVKGLATQA